MNARRHAHETLFQLFQHQQSLSKIPKPLDPWGQHLCYTVCRFFPYVQEALTILLSKPVSQLHPRVYVWLLMAITELEYMNTPPHAVVNETVEGARKQRLVWACNLINASLRRYLRERTTIATALKDHASASHALPRWLLQRWQTDFPHEWRLMAEAAKQPPPLTLRVNTQQLSTTDYLTYLKENEINAFPHPQVSSAIIVQPARDVSEIPGFSEGWVSVQDAAAQCAATLLNPQPGERILDACAAPGGKTIHLLEHQPESFVWACDVSLARLNLIHSNLRRYPSSLQKNLTIDCVDWTQSKGIFVDDFFDKMLLDVPCSSLGIIQRQPDLKILRKPEHLAITTQKQFAILKQCWPLLKNGGTLLYVTCSVMPEENDGIISQFLKIEPHAQVTPLSVPWGVSTEHGQQIIPGVEPYMDGFYFCMLHKTVTPENASNPHTS